MTRSKGCPLCERPGPYSEAALCPYCSAHDALRNAFAEGRARKAAAISCNPIVPPPKSLDCGS